jgi:hypothetical protein
MRRKKRELLNMSRIGIIQMKYLKKKEKNIAETR